MRINFRHGILSTQAGGFLFHNASGNVDLLANNRPFTVNIAQRMSNYIHSEDNTVANAWEGTFLTTLNYWLYMEFDSNTFERTFGFTTEEPVAQANPPLNPTDQSTWFNTETNEQFRWIGSSWALVIRVFVARMNNRQFFSVSQDSPDFTGTQIGSNQSVLSGRILYSEYGKPILRSDRTFFTTEDQFFTNQSQVVGVRLESNVSTAKSSATSLAKYQLVALDINGTIRTAQYNDVESRIIAVVTEDLLLGETGNIVIQGVINNPEWDFSDLDAGTPMWVLNGELSRTDPHAFNPVEYPAPRVPVARVLSQDSIVFEQGLGGVGPTGPTGSVENLPPASTTSLGAVVLSTPPATPSVPVAIGSNDPRLIGAPFTPVGHTHSATEISVTTSGNLSSANVQLTLEELDAEKFDNVGGTISGDLTVDGITSFNSKLSINDGGLSVSGDAVFNSLLTLSNDPIAPFEAATKRYVDNLTSGLQWLDPVCLANLIGDDVFDPSTLTPEDGDAYILPTPGVDAWDGFAANDVVRWDDPNTTWINGGQLGTNFPELRFLIAGTSSTPVTGSFVGREREIAIYSVPDATPTYEVPVNTNAVYVCSAFSSSAYSQYVYDSSADVWRQTGGAQNGLATDTLTIKQVGSTISTISYANGGQVDAATYRGLDLDEVFAPIVHNHDTLYSQLGHVHNAADVVIAGTPLTSPNFGTPITVANTQITANNVRDALLDVLARKATNQPLYSTVSDLPPANTSQGMNALVLTDNKVRFAIGGEWVENSVNDGSVQNHQHRINYDLTFFSAGPIAAVPNQILGRTIVSRAISIPPNSLIHARVITAPEIDVEFQMAINGSITPIRIAFSPLVNDGLFVVGDTGATNYNLNPGDYIDLISPVSSDASIADIALSIVAVADTGTP